MRVEKCKNGKCGKSFTVVFQNNKNEIWYSCPHCGTRYNTMTKKPERERQGERLCR